MNNTVKLNSIHFCGENLSDLWGNITAVETGTASYTFAYNGADLPLAVYVEGNEAPLVTYLYNSTLTESTGVQYANGLTVTYEYDTIGNISKVLENGVAVAEYEYDSNMNLISATENGFEYVYLYTSVSRAYSVDLAG